MTLGWEFPKHIFDQHTAYLAASNILLPHNPDEIRRRPRKRLPDACRAYGVDGWEKIDKDVISKDIGEGRWRDHGQDAVYRYCEEDVRASALLLKAQLCGNGYLAPADAEKVLHWSNYSAKAIAESKRKACSSTLRSGTRCKRIRAPLLANCYGSLTPVRQAISRFTPPTASGAITGLSSG